MSEKLGLDTMVEYGEPGTDDYDRGWVLDSVENSVLVGWCSGVRCWVPRDGLRPVPFRDWGQSDNSSPSPTK